MCSSPNWITGDLVNLCCNVWEPAACAVKRPSVHHWWEETINTTATANIYSASRHCIKAAITRSLTLPRPRPLHIFFTVCCTSPGLNHVFLCGLQQQDWGTKGECACVCMCVVAFVYACVRCACVFHCMYVCLCVSVCACLCVCLCVHPCMCVRAPISSTTTTHAHHRYFQC